MNPNLIIQLALGLLGGAIQLVNEIKGQSGVSDDAIAAQVQTITQGNDAAYAKIIAALSLNPTPVPSAKTTGAVKQP